MSLTFSKVAQDNIAMQLVSTMGFQSWFPQLSQASQNWVKNLNFTGFEKSTFVISNVSGGLAMVALGIGGKQAREHGRFSVVFARSSGTGRWAGHLISGGWRLRRYAAEAIIPPPKNAIYCPKSNHDPSHRGDHIASIQSYGSLAWQTSSGYNQWSRGETLLGIDGITPAVKLKMAA